MKTAMAAVVAGLVGAGATAAVFVSGVIPQKSEAPRAAVAGVLADETEALRDDVNRLRAEINRLRTDAKLPALAPAQDPRVDALAAEVAQLKAQPKPAPVAAPAEGPDAGTPTFDTAVRDVLTQVEAERREERRQQRQADRVQSLEEEKLRLVTSVPQMVGTLSERWGIPEASKTDVSNVLVLHAQTRAEIRSDRQRQVIDGLEVDEPAHQQKLKDLDQATQTSLAAYASAENAQRLVLLFSRTRGDATPAEAPQRRNREGGRTRGARNQ